MTYTAEQIEAAARLVPEYAAVFHYSDGEMEIVQKSTLKKWQPWADTEAGSADWAVLDTAVYHWFATVGHDSLMQVFWDYVEGGRSGDLAKRKAVTMAAAIAIGEFLTGEEGK